MQSWNFLVTAFAYTDGNAAHYGPLWFRKSYLANWALGVLTLLAAVPSHRARNTSLSFQREVSIKCFNEIFCSFILSLKIMHILHLQHISVGTSYISSTNGNKKLVVPLLGSAEIECIFSCEQMTTEKKKETDIPCTTHKCGGRLFSLNKRKKN